MRYYRPAITLLSENFNGDCNWMVFNAFAAGWHYIFLSKSGILFLLYNKVHFYTIGHRFLYLFVFFFLRQLAAKVLKDRSWYSDVIRVMFERYLKRKTNSTSFMPVLLPTNYFANKKRKKNYNHAKNIAVLLIVVGLLRISYVHT